MESPRNQVWRIINTHGASWFQTSDHLYEGDFDGFGDD